MIGPRPALTYHPWPYNQYDEYQKHMFDVLPGVTGMGTSEWSKGGTLARAHRIECVVCSTYES